MKIIVKDKSIKTFEVDIKDPTLDERIEITEAVHDMGRPNAKIYRLAISVRRNGTSLTDEEINIFSDDQQYALSRAIFKHCSKKK